jgi:hypothetical protein
LTGSPILECSITLDFGGLTQERRYVAGKLQVAPHGNAA